MPQAPPAPTASQESSPFERLPPLRICHVNTRQCLTLRLYDAAGRVDETNARQLDTLLGDSRQRGEVSTIPLHRRVLQLLYRTAYHFESESVEVVSGYRKPRRKREGPHATGSAIDFKLPNVPAATVAAYLRRLPRVGVGVYTHPRTQYVHLDVREQSYHWIDASPPNRTWRERPIRTPGLLARDAQYVPESDWPEAVAGAIAR